MYARGLMKLVTRISFFIIGLLIINVTNSVYPLYAIIISSSATILVLRGKNVLVSFLMGLFFLLLLGVIVNGVYGYESGFLSIFAIYSLVVAVSTTITLDEVFLFIDNGKRTIPLYVILVMRFSTVLLERFWRNKEFYTAIKKSRTTYWYSLHDLLGGLPRHVLEMSEYIHVHFNGEVSTRDQLASPRNNFSRYDCS